MSRFKNLQADGEASPAADMPFDSQRNGEATWDALGNKKDPRDALQHQDFKIKQILGGQGDFPTLMSSKLLRKREKLAE